MPARFPFLFLLFLLAALSSVPALAQEPPGRIDETIEGKGFTKIAIAVPDARAAGGTDRLARELVETVRADLDFSGYFDVVSPALYGMVASSPSARNVQNGVPYEAWREIGAAGLALTEVTLAAGKLDVQARVHDAPTKTLVLARRYGGSQDAVRRLGHQIADDIVKAFTGQTGISLSRITFVSGHKDAKEVYLMDYDGQRIRRITTSGVLNLSPAWSPDAHKIAFVSWRGHRPGIQVLDDTGKSLRVKTAAGELTSAPEWSPDGRRLVYTSSVDGNAELYVTEVESGRTTRLTRSPAIDTSPSFSPNGREIAFTSDRGGSPQIYLMDAEGLNVRRVSFDSSYADSPAWSPDGSKLAYAARYEGRFDVVVLDMASGKVTRLTRGEGNNENPRWSPDGRHLVFASSRTGTYDIYTMRADGSDVRRHTKGGDAFMPDWR
jgi:TolB protein